LTSFFDVYLFIPVALGFWILILCFLLLTRERRLPLLLGAIWILFFLLTMCFHRLFYLFIAAQVVLAAYAYYRFHAELTV